mgnify:FL=1
MVIRPREKDRIIHSIARFLSGLKPKASNRYYFELFKYCSEIKKIKVPNDNTCFFCGKKFSKKSTLVLHISKKHEKEIYDLCLGKYET